MALRMALSLASCSFRFSCSSGVKPPWGGLGGAMSFWLPWEMAEAGVVTELREFSWGSWTAREGPI